jgi:hypothetical protein
MSGCVMPIDAEARRHQIRGNRVLWVRVRVLLVLLAYIAHIDEVFPKRQRHRRRGSAVQMRTDQEAVETDACEAENTASSLSNDPVQPLVIPRRSLMKEFSSSCLAGPQGADEIVTRVQSAPSGVKSTVVSMV